MTTGLIRWLAAATLAVALYGCSGAAGPTQSVDADATITSTALDFDVKQFALPADEATTIHFVNVSPALHNVAIYIDSSVAGPVFTGQPMEQGDTVYDVPALPAGTYYFRCDLHPEMNGTVTVAAVARASP